MQDISIRKLNSTLLTTNQVELTTNREKTEQATQAWLSDIFNSFENKDKFFNRIEEMSEEVEFNSLRLTYSWMIEDELIDYEFKSIGDPMKSTWFIIDQDFLTALLKHIDKNIKRICQKDHEYQYRLNKLIKVAKDTEKLIKAYQSHILIGFIY